MDDYRYKSASEPIPPNQRPYTTQHQSSTLTYFTQQAIRAGYVAPRVGNTLDQRETMRRDVEKELPLDHLRHQPTNMHENIRREIETLVPQFVNTYDHLQHQPINMREMIWREIEKERIREEIIAEENARRRMLEFEVRREIMMERQLAKQNEGIPPSSSPGMAFSSTLPFLKQHGDPTYAEEIIARSIEERMGRGISVSGLGARNEIGRLSMVPFEEQISEIPFQQRSVDPKISELKPVSLIAEPIISERQPLFGPILLAKSNTSLPGAKRKAVTLPVEVASRQPSFDVPKKNGKEDWSCALCQVSATSERGLSDHLRGKKHKSKEAALRTQRNGKNYSIGLFPKKPKTTTLIEEARDDLNMEEMVKPKVELLPQNITGVGSSLVILEKESSKDNTSSPAIHQKKANAAQKKPKSKDHTKKYKFWCETCKIGALSEKSMEAHRVGKKHMNRLQEPNGCGVATSTTKAESTQTVDEALEKAKLRETDVVATSTTKCRALKMSSKRS